MKINILRIDNLKQQWIPVLKFIGFKAAFWLIIAFFCSLFLSFVELGVSVFIQTFLQSLGILKADISIAHFKIPHMSPWMICFFLFLIAIFRFLGQTIATHSSYFSLEYINCRMKILVIRDLIFRSSSSSHDTSLINYRISELFPKASTYIATLCNFFTYAIQCISILVILFFTAWKESIIGITGIAIIGIVVLKINKKLRRHAAIIPQEQYKLNHGIQKISKNLLLINIMKKQDEEQKDLFESTFNYSIHAIKAAFLNTLATTISPLMGILMLIVIILVSQISWHTPGMTLLAFLYLLIRFIQNMSIVVGYFGGLNIGRIQFEQTLSYFNSFTLNERTKFLSIAQQLNYIGSEKKGLKLDYNNTKQTSSNTKQCPPKIHVKNIHFSYSEDNSPIFSDFKLDINSGEQLGIIGPSGTGKSTLLMLLLGMLSPQKGSIYFDNQSPQEYFSIKEKRVGYVGPEPFLIKGSLKENLLYGIQIQVDDKDIMNSLEQAQLSELAQKIGLDYLISEDQQGLSAGQKQRLCLARALLNKPDLLILDEATANLDNATELEIADTLSIMKGKCTTLIVSHRQGILKYADRIIELFPHEDEKT